MDFLVYLAAGAFLSLTCYYSYYYLKKNQVTIDKQLISEITQQQYQYYTEKPQEQYSHLSPVKTQSPIKYESPTKSMTPIKQTNYSPQKLYSPIKQFIQDFPDGNISKILFGIGNPGKIHENNLHNVGTLFCDFLCQKMNKQILQNKGTQFFIYYNQQNEKIAVFKSSAYVNVSGQGFEEALALCNIKSLKGKDIMIVQDDLQNKFGKIKVKLGGSAQGHTGIISIIESIKSDNFLRLKIGISRPQSKLSKEIAKHLMSDFTDNQITQLNEAIFVDSIKKLKEFNFY